MDSWLERLALRTGVPVWHLLPILGRPMRRRVTWRMIHQLPATMLRRMEQQTGLAPGCLARAIPSYYSPLGWPRQYRSRYCPACLAEHGFWRLRWQLPWTFACPVHRVLLADICPACATPPRRHVTRAAGLHPVSTCSAQLPGGGHCLADLTAAPAIPLTAGEPRLRAQEWIDAGLDRYEQTAHNGEHDDLADLEAVADWIRIRAAAADFAAYGPATVTAFAEYLGRQKPKPARHAFTDPLIVAAVSVAATTLLRADNSAQILTALRPLLGKDFAENARNRQPLTIKQTRWKTLSPPRRATLLGAVDPLLSPLDRLRLRSHTPHASLPSGPGPAADRARHIPQLLWPEWTVRLAPASARSNDTLRVIVACCLLLPGSHHTADHDTVRGLRQRWPRHAAPFLTGLGEPAQTQTITAICRIADYLDQHGSPIDYHRRRTIIDGDLLTWPDWRQLCFDTMSNPGGDRRLLDARRYLYQTVTGADLTQEHHDLTLHGASDRHRFTVFTDGLTTSLRQALHNHAIARLQQMGIDEPLTWAPPASCAEGLTLLGRDPQVIDLDLLHQLIMIEKKPLGQTSRILQTSLDHVRYALQHLVDRPRPARVSSNSPQAGNQLRKRADVLLTPEFFNREYMIGGKSLVQLQAETGIHRKLLAEYANRASITFSPGRERRVVDEQWLRDQHLRQGRSIQDLAAQLGASPVTLRRAARRYDVAVRRDIRSPAKPHPEIISRLPGNLPHDVRSAIDGKRQGCRRLDRFQQIVGYPTFSAAARGTGACLITIRTQIARLERDVGAKLLNRGTPRTPMSTTPRGTALLRALQDPDLQTLLREHGIARTNHRASLDAAALDSRHTTCSASRST